MEVKIVKVNTDHWIIAHPEKGGRVIPGAFNTEKAARRYLAKCFSWITVVN